MIPVVVVESHHHVLEHIHAELRKRRLLCSKWSMLHFDSHADLACPGPHIPAASCFQPRKSIRSLVAARAAAVAVDGGYETDTSSESSCLSNNMISDDKKCLYELLDSSASGIAEWILPLVFAANLRAIHWIRPPDTIRQLPTGLHEFNVGAWLSQSFDESQKAIQTFLDLPMAAIVKVDSQCSYYLDDDSYAPTNNLLLRQPLLLSTSEIDPSSSSSFAACIDSQLEGVSESTVDVCLDYFVCLNPFIADVESLDSGMAKILLALASESTIFQAPTSPSAFMTDLGTFRVRWIAFIQFCRHACNGPDEVPSSRVACFLTFYDAEETARHFCETIQKLIAAHSDNPPLQDLLIKRSVESIPYLTMPHNHGMDRYINVEENEAFQTRLSIFKSELRVFKNAMKRDPFIITIARSMNDGFTPRQLVDDIQSAVLHEIHECFCGCALTNMESNIYTGSKGDCHLKLVFDCDAA